MAEVRFFFATQNKEKLRDVVDLIGGWTDIRIDHFYCQVDEIQHDDVVRLVENKLLEYYRNTKRPTIVDHTCLHLDAIAGLPGTQTGQFWRKIGGHGICKLVQALGNNKAEVSVCLGYTDGTQVATIVRRATGSIASSPKGDRRFDWDLIFIPKGSKKTYAEMSPTEKNKSSPRSMAFVEFKKRVGT